eukprot:TRINITY_DN3900_c0_g1_i3.p1 TRINITY_DN3900_c0_g1~~TRINITY_DN3900_c0_g1_i3.p1  ORF type:complete len:507 (+),score=35.82 TRINITY_DN3900_c0_g1_i3:89-1522(+)
MCIRDSNYTDSSLSLTISCPRGGRECQLQNFAKSFKDGCFYFNDLEVSYAYNTLKILQIETDVYGEDKKKITHPFRMRFRPCVHGEEPVDNRICYPCPKNKYSLTNNSACAPCDHQAMICHGGNLLAPNKSYWRYSTEIDRFIKCPIASACRKGEELNQTANCSRGYTGNLCYRCTPFTDKTQNRTYLFGKSSAGVCVYCDQMSYINIITGIMIALSKIALLIWAIRSQTSRNHNIQRGLDRLEASQHSILIKIMMTYYQVIMIIFKFPFENMIPTSEEAHLNFFTRFLISLRTSSDRRRAFSWDCLLNNYDASSISYESPRFNIKLVTITPLFYIVMTGLFLYVRLRGAGLSAEFRVDILSAIIIIIFNQLPDIQQYALGMLSCENLADKSDYEAFLIKDYDVECWASEHLHYLIIYGIPCILIYLIGGPLYIWLKLRMKQKVNELDDLESISIFGFLYYGYKDQVFFWQISSNHS